MASPSGRAWAACLPHGGDVGGAARRSSLLPSHRLIIPSTTGAFFSFPPDPLPPVLLGLLTFHVPPSPAGGGAGYVMACGGGRAGCLLAFSSPVPLSRSCSFACCYMPPVRRFALFYPGRCVAIYGLFLPLSCRRWRISIYTLKWHPVASHGHFRRCCPLPFLGSPRRLVLALLPLLLVPSRLRFHGRWCGCFPAVSW